MQPDPNAIVVPSHTLAPTRTVQLWRWTGRLLALLMEAGLMLIDPNSALAVTAIGETVSVVAAPSSDAAYQAGAFNRDDANSTEAITAGDATEADDAPTSEVASAVDGLADSDPQHDGDGSVTWPRDGVGEWRNTTHEDAYLERSDTIPMAIQQERRSDPASRNARGSVESAVKFALAQLGKPFKMGGNGPNSYDCSGLVQQSFRRAGIRLPRVANDQYRATTPVRADELRRGDLLFWSADRTVRGIYHVAIYLGDHRFVEAGKRGTTVRIAHLNHRYWPSFMGRP